MVKAENTEIRWQKLKEIFDEAVELPTEKRSAYLSEIRIDERTISEEVENLLKAEKKAEDFLQKPVPFNLSSLKFHSFVGESFGKYRVTGEIGQGGMGTVFEAVREDGEFDQKVAVKIINQYLLSAKFIERFKIERQILADLKHPNIVRLLDGGVTESSVPYYVMEFIEGVTVTEFCRQNELSVNRRLEIFLQICEAVSYAHQHLVIHRDLKPSNILVTEDRELKLLDFGIAKVFGANSEIQTQTMDAPLTPAYSSPEQVKNESISIRSDIYSLGVILFQLLSFETPYKSSTENRIELLMEISEGETKRLRQVVNSQNGLKNLSKQKIADLENICSKSLNKETGLRYSSVEAFAEDINAYLNDLPVKAHPPSLIYTTSKFIKRNRLLVSIAAISLLLITVGAGIATWQYSVARREREIAEERFRQVRQVANSLILDYHDEVAKLPGSTKLREKLVRDALKYLDAISKDKTDDPELLKELAIAYREIARVQGQPFAENLGNLEDALSNYQKSADLLEKANILKPTDATIKKELEKTYGQLAMAEIRRQNFDKAKELVKKAIAITEDLAASDREDYQTQITLIDLRLILGDCYADDQSAIKVYKQALNDAHTLYSRTSKPKAVRYLHILSSRLSSRYRWLGEELNHSNQEEALKYFLQALDYSQQNLRYLKLRKSFGEKLNERSEAMSYLENADNLVKVRRFQEATEHLKVAENLITEYKSVDDNNQEGKLSWVSTLVVKQKLFAEQEEINKALEIVMEGFSIAKEVSDKDRMNADALAFVTHFADRAAILLEKQNNKSEAENYRKIVREYKKSFKEKFGRDLNARF